MLTQALADLGEWNWIVLGVVLLVLEILVPGVFLLWIGIAAILTGALSLQFQWLDAWGWQVQVLIFLALSLVSAYVGARIMGKPDGSDTDEPLLNRRAEQLVGRTATLEEPIVDGYGRIRLGDTIWRVTGPDLPARTRVRVKTVEKGKLVVEIAETV